MTTFPVFTDTDFDVFLVPGLEARMERLIEQVRPKLTDIGNLLSPFLSAQCGHEMFPHVAKHARRTVNPPNDTWVAFAPNKRGYKAYPHFQVGMWSTHLFIQFAIIYESAGKAEFADKLSAKWKTIRKGIPDHYFWSIDHMQPESTPHSQMTNDKLHAMTSRLKTSKNAESMCGLALRKGDPLLADGEALKQTIEETFNVLMPLYRLTV
jgi:uncharacterized protein YktB (UPF0637 family)